MIFKNRDRGSDVSNLSENVSPLKSLYKIVPLVPMSHCPNRK